METKREKTGIGNGILVLGVLGVFVVAAMLGGCIGGEKPSGSEPPKSGGASGSLSISGSTTVLPAAQTAADEFMAKHSGINVQVSAGGSSVGIQEVGSGTADIGMSSRDLKAEEKTKYPDLVEHVIAKDGIAVIVNPANSVSSLTLEQIKKIYEGTYTNWKELGGDDKKIVVVSRDSASGTREFFLSYVMKNGNFTKTALEKNSNGAVQQTIAQTPGAIGYVGLGYLKDVKAIKIDKDGQLIEPTMQNVLDKKYPISRDLYMLTKGPAAGTAKEYLDFIMSDEGQKIVEKEGFVPLRGEKPSVTEPQKSGGSSGSLSISGSTTVLPIAQKTADEFMAKNPKVNVKVSAGGSSVGVQEAGSGTANIGMSSRDLKNEEKTKYPDLVQYTVAKDGIAVIVNPANSVSSLTLEQIKKIYEGTYTNWKELGGDDKKIVVVSRDSASGTREFFLSYVMKNGNFTKTALEKNSNGAVQQTIAQTPGAIGYVGLGFLDNVKAIKIDKDGQLIEPTLQNVLDKKYPISRDLYMLTKGPAAGTAKEYLDFIMSDEGQKIVEKEGFVPLS